MKIYRQHPNHWKIIKPDKQKIPEPLDLPGTAWRPPDLIELKPKADAKAEAMGKAKGGRPADTNVVHTTGFAVELAKELTGSRK